MLHCGSSTHHCGRFEADTSYLNVRLTDEADQDIYAYFRSMCAFLGEVRWGDTLE